jgi:hypothetical protein
MKPHSEIEQLQSRVFSPFYLSLGTHRRAAVDLGAEPGGRLGHPPRPAGLVASLGGRPGGVFRGAIPSQPKENNGVMLNQRDLRNHTRAGKANSQPEAATLPGAVAAGIQLEEMHFVQG